jgi:hypothetical protein
VQIDEVYFRDTAHGFLAWAVASLATAVLLASAVGSIVNGGIQAVATLTAGAATVTGSTPTASSGFSKLENETDGMGYFIDALFRNNANITSITSAERYLASTNSAATTSEVTRIFVNSMRMESLPAADLTYISQLVSRHTGLTQQDAETRVNDIYASLRTKARNAEIAAKEAAEKAREASIYTTLWLFVSLLMGAFSASLAATWGGRCRDA